MKTAIVYKEGKAFLITEMPEESPLLYTTNFREFKDYNEAVTLRLERYNKALEAAKANAIEVAPECQELVKQLVEQSVRGVPMTGVPYMVEGIEFEVKEGTECKRGKTFVCIQKQPCGCPVRQLALIRLSNLEVGNNSRTCGDCGKPLTKVRPGKEQCDNIKCPSNAEVGKEHQDNIEMITGHPDRNWEEDFSHENGKYINRCYGCELHFMGHKRRTRCKKCCVGKEETEKESQESMWAEVINDARWYNGSPHDLQQLTNHFRNVRNFEIRRKNPTL
jgi:hypothetical protein